MTDISVIASYGKNGSSSRVRLFQWLDFLQIDADIHDYISSADNSFSTLTKNFSKVISAEIELRNFARNRHPKRLFLSRQASPFSNGSLEARLLKNAEFSVYDFDDALMHYPSSKKEMLWSKRKTWERSVATADLVIAGNEFLANKAEEHNKEIVIIPSCVEHTEYTVKQDFELQIIPTAVWLGSPSTEGYLQTIADPLLAAHKRSGLRLKLISTGNQSLGKLTPMVDRINWSLDTFAQEMIQADFGIMPLKDNQWARGKCAYKLLQYGAAGLPMIGSPVGVNEKVLAQTGGFAANSASDWIESIETLIQDLSVSDRKSLGQRGRAAVTDHYSYSAWGTSWKSALKL